MLKKFFKSVVSFIFIGVILLPTFISPFVAHAADNRTIRSILADIEKQKKDLENNKTQQTLTDKQIKQIKANITLIDAEIKKGQQDIINLNNDIYKLEEDITKKDKEIKTIINFLQISSGEEEYMEYIFGAKDFSDFIYRMAITEQLSDYNDKLIKEFNSMIETNKQKKIAIQNKEKELNVKQINLQAEIGKLSSQIATLSREQGDIEDGIKKSEAQVKSLIDDGCDMDETVDACYTRLRTLPSDTSFWRPLASSSISSLYGWRSYWIGNTYYEDFHYGLDMRASIGTPVYAVANGTVASKMYWDGTGYSLYIYHKVNGVKYTSVYEHLNSYNVSVNQNVTKDTIVAYSGNTGVSSGPHLHLSILTGWAGIDYSYWSTTYFNSNVDPKTKINFPAGYGSFETRTRNCSLGPC